MKRKKKITQNRDSCKNGSKWLELANLISRKNRDISIIKDIENDPSLKRIHTQRDKIFLASFNKKK